MSSSGSYNRPRPLHILGTYRTSSHTSMTVTRTHLRAGVRTDRAGQTRRTTQAYHELRSFFEDTYPGNDERDNGEDSDDDDDGAPYGPTPRRTPPMRYRAPGQVPSQRGGYPPANTHFARRDLFLHNSEPTLNPFESAGPAPSRPREGFNFPQPSSRPRQHARVSPVQGYRGSPTRNHIEDERERSLVVRGNNPAWQHAGPASSRHRESSNFTEPLSPRREYIHPDQTHWGSPTFNRMDDNRDYFHVEDNPAWQHANEEWRIGDSSASSVDWADYSTRHAHRAINAGAHNPTYVEEAEDVLPLPRDDPPPAYSRRNPQRPQSRTATTYTNPFLDPEFMARYGQT